MKTSTWVPIAVLSALILTACSPTAEPTGTPEPTESSPAPSPTATVTETPTPEPEPTEEPSDDIALPERCEDAFTQVLMRDYGPLNDPWLQLPSAEDPVLQEMLETLPTLRCTWGMPSEVGIATNITVVSADEAETVRGILTGDGIACTEMSADPAHTRCEFTDEVQDENGYATWGETHDFRANIWISTAWVNIDTVGYNNDILATLWG